MRPKEIHLRYNIGRCKYRDLSSTKYVYVYRCVLAVYNTAQAQRISNCEFTLWTFLQETESRVATFLAETCVMSHQCVFVCVIDIE